MRKLKLRNLIILVIGLCTVLILLYQLPAVNRRVSWQIQVAKAYLRGVVDPVDGVPTPKPAATNPAAPTSSPAASPSPIPSATPLTPEPTATPAPSPTPIPAAVSLPAPAWEKQDINNCGPASLAMYLRFYGWEGNQLPIAELLKPLREDRNVNVEELVYYVRTRAGWLNAEYRVGGDIPLLKRLLAAGIPVMVEESFYFEEPFWPNDDLWAAHYNLLTGYDDATQTFTGQDSFHGPDQRTAYDTLDEYWQVFNRVYILVYPPGMEETVKAILGEDWEVETNRQRALEAAQAEIDADQADPYAWFNLGTNLVYFERWGEAANAFDRARELGLPQRMLRYQFTPFFAYFHTRRIEDLLALTEYALKITPNAEEALLWHGWGLYRNGDTPGAITEFQAALKENPNYSDAQYALNFARQNP
ncbi:MAG TPA: C39 family peptidase [Anaerolineales bacterium]|nr:C39 family peptidase [Anaerolineales bacterium]